MTENQPKPNKVNDSDDSRVDAIAAVVVLVIVVSAFVYILSTLQYLTEIMSRPKLYTHSMEIHRILKTLGRYFGVGYGP